MKKLYTKGKKFRRVARGFVGGGFDFIGNLRETVIEANRLE